MIKKLFLTLLLTLLLAAGTALYTLYYYDAPGSNAQPTTVVFKRGTGFVAIVDSMAEHGIIRYPLLFKALAVARGDARKFKAGEYAFSAAITPRLIMEMIGQGRVVVHKITIAEGLRVADVLATLARQPELEGDITQNIAEGSLLPQTYHFVYGDSRAEMVSRMQAGMQATLSELWEKRQEGLPLASPEQALVLASIVEKETSIPSERPLVASVFINRLRQGMRLQTDPTVIYAIEKDKGPLGRALMTDDLTYDSPYNTYKVEGLPPGPIANPGRASLEAVLNPPATDYLYFVATGTGGHNFSATLKEHNGNVKTYRKELKKKKVQQPSAYLKASKRSS